MCFFSFMFSALASPTTSSSITLWAACSFNGIQHRIQFHRWILLKCRMWWWPVWRAGAGSQETGPPLQTFQGHSESRLAMVWHPTNWTGCYCSGQTALAHTFTICVICARGRASPSSTVRQRTPPLGSLYPSDKCELPVPRLRTALQVQDRPAEPLPYPQIRGTDNVILETEGPPWWWWWWWWWWWPERKTKVWQRDGYIEDGWMRHVKQIMRQNISNAVNYFTFTYALATREDVWPVSTSLTTKLYGCKQELEKTTSFISRAALIV